jgi:hypothetical protein
MRVLPLVVALPLFAAACGSDGNVVSVFPDTGFVGRTTRVEVTGNDTSFGSGSTVDFGEGITVSGVTLVSPFALQVDLAIDADAPTGVIDVSVDGSTAAGAFELLSPVETEISVLEQGGFGSISITNLDLLHPFDLTTDQDGNFVNLDAQNDGDGVVIGIGGATANSISLSALIDVNATETGGITISASDGTTPNTTLLDSVTVSPRAPVVLAPGATMDFTVADNGSLFEITATEASMIQMRFASDDAFLPTIDILPASGRWDEEVAFHSVFFGVLVFDNRVVAAGDKFYVVISDGFGGGYQGTFSVRSIPLTGVTAVADTGDNGTAATAQVAAGTTVQFDGVLSADTDKDCFSVTTTVANQKIHVFTTDDNGQTDTLVEIFDLNDTTVLVTSEDADLGEDVVTAALLVPGSRSVCVSPSSFFEGFTNAAYKAFVVIEN